MPQLLPGQAADPSANHSKPRLHSRSNEEGAHQAPCIFETGTFDLHVEPVSATPPEKWTKLPLHFLQPRET
jgi:hypothetical protein